MAQQYSARTYGKVYGTAAAATGFTLISDVFRFPSPQLTWTIQHKFNTVNFLVTLFDADNRQFFADAKATSSNEIVVNLTKAESGYVNAVFIA
jgi:hypothetical protein